MDISELNLKRLVQHSSKSKGAGRVQGRKTLLGVARRESM
jgi:hypothetical protein